MTAKQPFSVMVKPVGSRCNLECGYCYYHKPGGEPQGLRRMTDEVLEVFIRQYIEASPDEVVSFVWHGGEPALAGLDFYRLVVELQRKYIPTGRSFRNNLQTNGTLLNGEFCDFLAGAGFDVGLSIDGTEDIHNTNRSGSYKQAVQAARELKRRGVQADLLCTVTARTAEEPLAVYRALREHDTGWVQFIPIVRTDTKGGITADSVRAEAYGRFLCDVFDEWVLNDLGKLDVQMFAETARVWAGGFAGLCWMSGTCGRALVVERDGGVYSCDHFVAPGYYLGNILESHLGCLADSSAQTDFGERKQNTLSRQCAACEWLNVCGGGCPKDRVALTDSGEQLNHLCGGLKRFFSYARPAIYTVTELSKQGCSPKQIMESLRTQLKSMWAGVGRNDGCPCGSGRKAKYCCWNKRV